MKIHRLEKINQNSNFMEGLSVKNGVTISSCGFITCAICEYLSEQLPSNEFDLKAAFSQISEKTMAPYIEKAMKSVVARRRNEVKKYYNQMTENQRIKYIRDWMANYEVEDYIESIADKMLNPNVYFWRQVAADHPEAL